MAKKSKENKPLLELGTKQRAGQLISQYLRAIGTEKTELVDIVIGPDEIKHKIVSKAEALARDIFNKALGKRSIEDGINVIPDPKITLEYRKLVLDRIDGRSGDNPTDEGGRRISVPDRISEMNRDRLNKLAKQGEEKK
jgi:hypothetical protein